MPISVLAFSSSREGNMSYLQTAVPSIHHFLGNKTLNIAFVPFAAITPGFTEYVDSVRQALKELPYHINLVTKENAKEIINQADAIMVGGGNTFKLLHDLYALDLIELIKEKVTGGTPYIGWSAGSNIAGATICTSNDMPIINPGSFEALAFFPFQINPHYYNQTVDGFNGETRNQRLAEFLQLNPSIPVVALPEGTALLLQENKLQLTGAVNALLFTWKNNRFAQSELKRTEDVSFLLNKIPTGLLQ